MSNLKHTPGPLKAGSVFKREGRAIFYTDTSKPGKWQRRLDSDNDGVFPEGDAILFAEASNLLKALLPFIEKGTSEDTVTITVKMEHVQFARDVAARAMGDL